MTREPAGGPVGARQRAARERFSRAAEDYVTSPSHARGAELPRLVAAATDRLGSLAGRTALDVASGGGHTARVLAEAGAAVTVSDLTPEMLAAAEAHLRSALRGAQLEFVAAAAEELPFEDGRFDVVSCRIAAHHFGAPRAFLAEARRVLAPGGVLLLVDNVAPEERELAAAMNEVERLRDPSHVQAYAVSTWVAWATAAGFEPYLLERFWRVKAVEPWLRRGRTTAADEAALRAFLASAEARVRSYLGWREAPDGEAELRHEVMLLAASAGVV